jgi:hypothetical protein
VGETFIFEVTSEFLTQYQLLRKPGRYSRYSDWATGWTLRNSNPGIGKKTISSPELSDILWGPIGILFYRHQRGSPGGKMGKAGSYPLTLI